MQCQNLYKSSSKQTIQTICILIHMISFNFVLIIKKSDALHEHILHKIGVLFGLNSNSVKSKNNPSDLNSLISNGVYACGDISSIKNLPSSMTTSGILIVFSNQPYIGQIIFSHVFFYTRFSTTSGNEWYDWMKIK